MRSIESSLQNKELIPLKSEAIARLDKIVEDFGLTPDQRENPRLEKESQFSKDLFRQDFFVNDTSFYDYVLALSDEEFIQVAQLSRFDKATYQQSVLDYLHEIKKCSDAQLKKEKILDLFNPGYEKSPLAKILLQSQESQKNKDNQPDPFYISIHSIIQNWIQSSLDIKTDSKKLITSLIAAYRQYFLGLNVNAQELSSKKLFDIFDASILIPGVQERACRFSKTGNNEINFTVTISPLIWSPPPLDIVNSDSKITCILGKLEYTLRFYPKNNRFKLIQCKTTGGFLEKLMSGAYEEGDISNEELKNKIYHDLLIAYHQYHNDESHEQFNFHKTLADKIGVSADFSGLDLTGLDFSGLDFSGLDFSGLNLTDVNFTNANLTDVNFTGANLTNTNFSGAKLQETKIANKKSRENFTLPENADYENTDLRGIDLSKVKNINRVKNLKGARLDKQQVAFLAKNYPRLLTGTDLRGVVYLEFLDLCKIDLSGITIDWNTILNLTSGAVSKDGVNQLSVPQPTAPAPLNNNFNYVFGSGAKAKILNEEGYAASQFLCNFQQCQEYKQCYKESSQPLANHDMVMQNLYCKLKKTFATQQLGLSNEIFAQLVQASRELNTSLNLFDLNLTNINLREYDLSKVDFKSTIFNEPINLHEVGFHNLRALALASILTKETKITLGESKSYAIKELVSAFCEKYNKKRREEINNTGCTLRFFAEKLKSDFVHSQLKEGHEVENLIKILEHEHKKQKSRTAQVLKQILDSGSLEPEPPTSPRDSLTS